MAITLAATWVPRGEVPRIRRLAPALCELYGTLSVALPPDTDEERHALSDATGALTVIVEDWTTGRHAMLSQAVAAGGDAVHACDFDRLLHWLEVYPDELRDVISRVGDVDCIVLGRTEVAWSTHPRCMVETEALFNMTFSHLLSSGDLWDFGAGSRLLSAAAAAHLVENNPPSDGWAIDAAWPLILQQAGFSLGYRAVDGLAWESADQYREAAAGPAEQAALAAEWDADPSRWQQRVGVADAILRIGLAAAGRR